jgi:prepilin-type N-terminal cleavage/methylation domain-containing protein
MWRSIVLMINWKNVASIQVQKHKYRTGTLMWVRLFSSSEASRQLGQSGFTLLESLIAMVVVSTLMVGIAPMLALTVAGRVQARRVDLAAQEARNYVNGIRAGSITIPTVPTGVTATTSARNLQAAPGLTSWTSDSSTRIDTNGNGFSVNDPVDLVIQPIRNGQNINTTTGVTEADIRRRGFDLVVRVYRADAFDSSGNVIGGGPLQINSSTAKTTASAFTGTLGSRTAPLTIVSSDAIDQSTQINDYRNRPLSP